MSETLFTTRSDMTKFMETQGSALLTERLGRDWLNLNTVVADQADFEVKFVLDFHLFEVCLDGRVTSKFRGEAEQGEQFDFVSSPGALHYVRPGSLSHYQTEGAYTVQQIYIDDRIFRQTAETIAPSDPDTLLTLGFEGIYDPALKNIAQLILREARKPSLGGELYADTLAMQIALQLFRRRLNGQGKQPFQGKLSNKELAHVISYMDAHLEEPGGLEVFAELVNMDTYGFARAFKEATGNSPHQFLISRRLYRADQYLRTSKMPLSEIAYACGFSSQSHMTTTFSNQLGETPGAIRKGARG